jgi:hypothetical protein
MSPVRILLGVVVSFALAAAGLTSLAGSAGAADPTQVSFTLEGCRNAAQDPVSLPNGSGDFVCDDDQYTTGNMGKLWAELDLVPHRVTLVNNNGAQTYTFAVAGDHRFEVGDEVGWDVISPLTLNTALSDAGCTEATSGAQTITPSGEGAGGIDQTIYRLITVTQPAGATCVYDYYMRLALGAHLFSGASLQSNLFNEDLDSSGIGEKRVSIPVNEIAPQELDKDMTATQGTDHVWNITKSSTPANLTFADTCDPATGARQAAVQVTVSWQRLAATPTGPITVVTNIYATNPASRTLTVQVTDDIRSGTTVLDSVTFAPANVPANTANFLVGTHTTTVPAGTTDLNDIATATYTDLVTGIPIPGSVTATASATVQQGGTATNQTATVTDVESITGAGLTFSVDSLAAGSASGTFGGGYVLGTATAGPVSWTSSSQSGNGSVTFNKTVYVDQPRITSGTLSDTATLSGSNGFSATANASTTIVTDASVSLAITKSLAQAVSTQQVFGFSVTDGALPDPDGTVSFTFPAGSAAAQTQTVTGLDPGVTYTITETTLPAGWSPQPPATRTVTLPSCSASVSFQNAFAPATAQVRKVTVPAGNEAGWTFTLTGPGLPAAGIPVTTTGDGFILFPVTLTEDGTYTVTETGQTGFDQTPPGPCTFTLSFPADSGAVRSCTFTNTQRGTATVVKTVSDPGGQLAPGEGFTFQIRQGATTSSSGTVLVTDTSDASGNVDFGGILLVPGTYQLCEINMLPGWANDIDGFTPDSETPEGGDNGVECVNFELVAGETEAFTVNNVRPPGGDARTIGFWKNHTACDGRGNQDPILEQTLDLAVNDTIRIGDLDVNTCLEAIRILNKSTVNNGRKMASDAAYGLAAQLLAARLNVLALAGTCPAATDAMAGAQALLDSINFTGVGDYLGPKVKGATLITRNQALGFASTLDDYNNNELCPST